MGGGKPVFSIGPGAIAKKGGKEYFFQCSDAESKYVWINALMIATGNPLYSFASDSADSDERAATAARISSSAVANAGILKKRGNDACADCGADLPTWAVVSPSCGVFVCIECIGVHRSLWAQHCKEVQLDSWSEEEIEIMRVRGNEVVNSELEYVVGFDTPKPRPESQRDVRESFIRAKYELRKFTQEATGALAPRAPQRDIVSAVRSVSISFPPKYIGVFFLVLQRVLPGAKGMKKLPCPATAVAVLGNGCQHVASRKAEPVSDQEFGDGIQWNEPLQLGVVHLSAPLTLSIMDSPEAPETSHITFTIVPSALELTSEPTQTLCMGEDRSRNPARLAILASFQGMT